MELQVYYSCVLMLLMYVLTYVGFVGCCIRASPCSRAVMLQLFDQDCFQGKHLVCVYICA
jgi:hypothetical protein